MPADRHLAEGDAEVDPGLVLLQHAEEMRARDVAPGALAELRRDGIDERAAVELGKLARRFGQHGGAGIPGHHLHGAVGHRHEVLAVAREARALAGAESPRARRTRRAASPVDCAASASARRTQGAPPRPAAPGRAAQYLRQGRLEDYRAPAQRQRLRARGGHAEPNDERANEEARRMRQVASSDSPASRSARRIEEIFLRCSQTTNALSLSRERSERVEGRSASMPASPLLKRERPLSPERPLR